MRCLATTMSSCAVPSAGWMAPDSPSNNFWCCGDDLMDARSRFRMDTSGKPGPESDLHVDHRHASLSRAPQHAGASLDEWFLRFRVDGNDAGLAVHSEHSRVSRIEGKCICHGASLSPTG